MRVLSPKNLKVLLLQLSLVSTTVVAARADGVLEWTSDPTLSPFISDSWVNYSLQPDANGIDAQAEGDFGFNNIQETASRDFTVTTAGLFNLDLDLEGSGYGDTENLGPGVQFAPLSIQYNADASITPVSIDVPIDGTALGLGTSPFFSGTMIFNLPSSTAIYLDAGDYVLSQDVSMQLRSFGSEGLSSNFETDLTPTPTPEPRSYAWLLMGIMILGAAVLRTSSRLADRF